MNIRKYNRINKTKPKGSHKFWCMSCDRQLIRVGQRCPMCKNKDKSKHQKP